MAEILHDIKPIAAMDHAQTDYVISRVEQVCTMRWRKHQMLMTSFGVEIKSDVFTFLIELRVRRGCETLREGGLTIKLV